MLNETQQEWLSEISEENLLGIFKTLRERRVQSLDVPQPNYEKGKLVQDEIAALYRIETELKNMRKLAIQNVRGTKEQAK